MAGEPFIERRDAVHAVFNFGSELHENAVNQQIGKAGHLRGRLPKQVELRGNHEHFIGNLAAPVAIRVGDQSDGNAGGLGLDGEVTRQSRIPARLEDNQRCIRVVAHQQLGKVAACKVQKLDPVAQILQLID